MVTGILAGTAGPYPKVAWGQDPPAAPAPTSDGAGSQAAPAADADQTNAQGGQVLTRGPVHEAFATPVVHDPAATPVVPKNPPAPIQEMPPDQKPAGQNVQWIPGYWSWDVSRDDFIWISGIWRETPPNSQWVPGYWHQVEGSSQWVPGSWIPISTGQAQNQPTYLPPPPKSLETGPNTPAPAPNVSWTPGYWSWQGSGYVWRPGFWAAVQSDWIWMPPHYVWTPSGYLFVAGYWDLPLANRGLMFAPVYYPQPIYAQPNFAFTPSISIVGSAVTANLFVQASTNQYLFGNYYAQNFVSVGITPWFSFTFASGPPLFYDPLFSYYAVINVQRNPAWVTQVREQYILRRDNVAMRPPVTFVEQTRLIERNVTINRDLTVIDHRTLAMPLSKIAADPIASKGVRLVQVHEAEREQIRRQVAQLHQFREQRLQQEREGARAVRGGAFSRPRPMNLPHSPVASNPAAHPAGSRTAVAQRGQQGHGAGAHGDAARSSEIHNAASREAQRASGTRAVQGVERQPAVQERRAAGESHGSRRPAQPSGTSRSAGQQSSRSTPERGRERPSEEENRRQF